MTTRRGARCSNCGEPVPGRFCGACGQSNTHYRVPLRELVAEVVGETLQLDSRIGRTLVPFLFRPGALTLEFLAGRRVRYTSPLRLYLLSSLVYFLVLSWTAPVQVQITPSPEVPPAAERRRMIEAQTEQFARFGALGLRLQQRLAALAERDEGEIALELGHGVLQRAPAAMFLLVPVFALLLLALFRGATRFYVDHLVFALHFHAFCYTALTFAALWPLGAGTAVARIGMLAHLLLGLRRVYRETWPRTLWKAALLAAGYVAALALAIVAILLLTVLAGGGGE